MSLDVERGVPVVPRRIQLADRSLLLSLSLSLAIAGCHVGPTGPSLGEEEPAPGPDSSSATPEPDGGDAGNATQDCVTLETDVTDDGNHPAGYEFTAGGDQGCVSDGCHTNNLGPSWTVAGSVYREADDGDPVVGAHIFLEDADGKKIELVTAQNGFFYTLEEMRAPIRTYASGCPDEIPMNGPASGNCNSGGCHDSDFRIFLPGEG